MYIRIIGDFVIGFIIIKLLIMPPAINTLNKYGRYVEKMASM